MKSLKCDHLQYNNKSTFWVRIQIQLLLLGSLNRDLVSWKPQVLEFQTVTVIVTMEQGSSSALATSS